MPGVVPRREPTDRPLSERGVQPCVANCASDIKTLGDLETIGDLTYGAPAWHVDAIGTRSPNVSSSASVTSTCVRSTRQRATTSVNRS
jgi:hypothetical protein